jgi:hypothetical protein
MKLEFKLHHIYDSMKPTINLCSYILFIYICRVSCCSINSFLCSVLRINICLFVLFGLNYVLSVLLAIKVSDHLFGMFYDLY